MNIETILMNLGIYPNKKAYYFIKSYVESDGNCMTNGSSMTKSYEAIAKKHGTTPKVVYDSIRRAIVFSDASQKMKNLDNYFMVKIYDEHRLLTNSEFLAILKLLADRADNAA